MEKRSFVRAKKRAHNGRLPAARAPRCAPVRARPSAHFGFAGTLRQNVWYPQVVRCHAKSKIARKYVHVFAGKGKTRKPENQEIKKGWKKKPGQKTLLFGKDSAFNVSLDLPGVSLSILRNSPSSFLFKVNSHQESAWEKTKNKYK